MKIFTLFSFLLLFIPFNSSAQTYDVVNIYLEDNNWEIPFAELWSNDGSSMPGIFINVNNNCLPMQDKMGPRIEPVLDGLGQKFILSPLPTGIYHFCPEIYQEQGEPLVQVVVVVVSEKAHMNLTDCCPNNCDLICGGDFENYPMTEPEFDIPNLKIFNTSGTNSFTFKSYDQGSQLQYSKNYVYVSSDGYNRKLFFPDIFNASKIYYKTNESNSYIDTLFDYGDESAFILPLREPLLPGEKVNIQFKTTMFNSRYETVQGQTGYVRLFGLTHDISSGAGALDYPRDKNTSPFSFSTNDVGYYIHSGLDSDPYGIPVSGTDVYERIPETQAGSILALTGVSDLGTMQQKSFEWENNTNQTISHIMIIGDGYTEAVRYSAKKDLPLIPQKYRVVVIDDFSVTKFNQEAICITGDSIADCSGYCTHIVNYKICRCTETESGPISFTVHIDSEYNGIATILPSGSFDANGNATVTLNNPGDCAYVSFEIDVNPNVLPGTYPIPLVFSTSSGCTMCTADGVIQSYQEATLTLTDCNFTCKCQEMNNIGVKNTTTYWSSLSASQKAKSCFAVEGNLIINEDVTISNKEFIMQDNSTLTIGNNKVEFNSSDIHGCEYLWNGFRLTHDNAQLIINNCSIKDAVKGITRVKSKATLVVYNTAFTDNLSGIILPYDYANPSTGNTPIIAEGNTFSSIALKPHPTLNTTGHKGLQGIYANNSIEILGGVATGKGNIFNNLGNGIFMDDCMASINNSTFKNIQLLPYYSDGGLQSGFGIYHSTLGCQTIIGGISSTSFPISTNIFKHVNIGVFAMGKLIANNSIMEDVNIGIRFHGTLGSELHSNKNSINTNRFGYYLESRDDSPSGVIMGNDINSNASSAFNNIVGIRAMMNGLNNYEGFEFHIIGNTLNGINKMSTGILLNYVGNWNLLENNINCSQSNFTGISIYNGEYMNVINNAVRTNGITLASTGISVNKFHNSTMICNLTEGTQTGFKINSINMASEFITNEMKTNSYKGLFMGPTATYTSANNGGIHILTGNKWSGSQNTVPALHLGTSTQIELSSFRTHNSTLPIFPVGYSAPGEATQSKWFAHSYTGIDLVGDCNIPGNGPVEWLTSYAYDSITYSQFDTSLSSQGKHLAYRFIKKNPGLPYSTELQSFYNVYGNSDQGKINNIRIQLTDAIKLSYLNRISINNYQNQITELLNSIRLLQEAVITAGSPGIPNYKVQVNIITNQIQSIKAQIKAVIHNHRTTRNTTLSILLQQLSIIPDPTDPPTYYEKKQLHHEIDYYLSGEADYGGVGQGFMLTLASMCPDYAGPSVFWARSFIASELPFLVWDDQNNCESSGFQPDPEVEIRHSDTERSNSFSVYPNPSYGHFVLSAPHNFEGRVIIRNEHRILYNGLYDRQPKSIDLSPYRGILFIQFVDNHHKVVFVQKHIIVK